MEKERKRFTEKDIEFLRKTYPLKGIEFCARKLDRSKGSIKVKAHSIGLKKYSVKKNIDINQFIDIKTPEVVYLMGFLWADGWVGAKRNVTCEIVTEDYLEIEPTLNKIGEWYVRVIKPSGESLGKKTNNKIFKT